MLFTYNTDIIYFMGYTVQFNIISVIFVNQFYSLGGSWCQKFKMMAVCS